MKVVQHNARFASDVSAGSLPAITGVSEKQIRYAEAVRDAYITELNNVIEAAGLSEPNPEILQTKADDAGISAAADKLFQRSDAKFWLDNKGRPFAILAAMA